MRAIQFCRTIALVLLALVAAGRAEVVSVRVIETEGIARRHWPLSFGLPLPRGVLRDTARLALRDAAGQALRLQARALAKWDDESLRWVLVDTQVDVGAGQSTTLHVGVGELPPRRAGEAQLRVAERADAVEVDTGMLRFRIPRGHFAILENAAAGRQRVKAPLTSSLTADGAFLPAAAPKRIAVVEKGPVRAQIVLEGEYGNGFAYEVRLDAWAGQPYVRVLHTFINRNPKPYSAVSDLALAWPFEASAYEIGVARGAPRGGALGEAAVVAVQPDNQSYRVGDESAPGQLAGWAHLSAPGGLDAGISARWFWQEYPKSFAAGRNGIVYHLWAAEGGSATVGTGAAKTHELAVWLAAGGTAGRELGGALARPLVAAVDPQWIVRTRALPNAVAAAGEAQLFVARVVEALQRYQARNAVEPWDDRGAVKCESGSERVRTGAFGVFNWGDWNFPGLRDTTKGCDAWGNLEYDTTQVLALTFAASGDPAAYDAMAAAARHFADVDVIHHFEPKPEWVGMNHPKNPLHFSFELGGVDLGHTWTEGLVSYHFLTGEARALDAARGIADYLVQRSRARVLRGNPRQWGWPQIALLAVYDVVREPAYRDAALRFAQYGMRSNPAGNPNHWKIGILADALSYTHAATGDKEIERWLGTYAEAAIKENKTDIRFYPAIAYVAGLRKSGALRSRVLERVSALDLGNWGKPFTIAGRSGFRIHSLLATAPQRDRNVEQRAGAVSPSLTTWRPR